MEELEARALHALQTPAQLEALRPAAVAAAERFAEPVCSETWRRPAARQALAG